MIGSAHDFGGRALGDDFAVVNEDNAVADFFDVAHVVRRVEHGDVVFALNATEGLADFVGNVGIEARGGLVEHDELGGIEEGFGEIDAGGFAGGEMSCDAVFEMRDFEKFEEGRDSSAAVFDPVDERKNEEILPDEEVRGQGCVGGAKVAAAEDGDAVAGHRHGEGGDGAGRGFSEAKNHVHGRGLASAVDTEEAKNFAAPKLKRQALDGDGAIKFFAEIFDIENDVAGRGAHTPL